MRYLRKSAVIKIHEMMNIPEAIPLTVFLLYIRNIDTAAPQNWVAPFIVSGLMALVIIILFLYKKRTFNRYF